MRKSSEDMRTTAFSKATAASFEQSIRGISFPMTLSISMV